MAVRLENVPKREYTARTIQRMYELADKAKKDIKIIDLATKIVRGCPHKDYACQAERIFRATKKCIHYLRDPIGVELVQDFWATAIRRAGDCDDQAVWIASLALSLGFPVRFKTISANHQRPDEWSHVYPVILIPEVGWMAADATVADSTFGWEPQGFKSKVWEPKR